MIKTSHRHCVFTIDENLRQFFLDDRTLLNCLFSAVRSVVLRMFHKDNKSELFTPGVICVLHTFGRDLKWNPHIHCLITEGGIGNSGLWRKPSQTNVTQTKPQNILADTLVIATSRIDNYDVESVTFHYNRHEDDKLVTETVPVLEFIKRLIQHIPEKHFKQIRYYGIYARHKESDKKLNLAVPKEKRRLTLSFSRWRNCIAASFDYDPLKCPHCGETMALQFIYRQKGKIISFLPFEMLN